MEAGGVLVDNDPTYLSCSSCVKRNPPNPLLKPKVSPDVSLAEFYVVGYRQRRVLEVTISFKDKAIIVQKVVLSSGIQDIFGPD